MRRLLALLPLLATNACVERTLTYPSTHAPVMLSRVDRIGGRESAPGRVLSDHQANETLFVSATSETKRTGNVQVTTRTTDVLASQSDDHLTEKLEGRHDRDVRLSGVDTSNWVVLSFGAVMFNGKVESTGRVVEVKP